MSPDGPDLRSLLDDLALASPGIERQTSGDAVEFATRGRAFAAAEPSGSVAFRLRADVARAAVRTPGVSTSGRGPDWIVLAPDMTDRYGRDRAAAWFEHARKQAAEERPPH